MTERIHSEVSVWLGGDMLGDREDSFRGVCMVGGDMLGDREDSFRGVCMVGGRHVG